MFPEAGEKLGPYEILGELGGGGMARVYRAWDGRLHREVAIKVIDDRIAMPGIGERFLREARAASGLNHPNICTIFDIGEQDGAPYLVMELLEGETLRERINQSLLSVEEILRYSAEVSDALTAAHARGIVHRDVKPANIFLMKKPNGFPQAKVLDFGLAKVDQYANEERDFVSNLTSMGATVGTVSYMSPEQARGEKLDARSDLFSLGVVMYEMATGQLPFRGNTSALVFVQLLGQMAPEPIRKLNGQIPADLEQVIMKLLAKSARARFQSATELTDELQELAEQRSGWLTRLKVTPPVESAVLVPKAPEIAARMAEPARPKLVVEETPPDFQQKVLDRIGDRVGDRLVPARPGDPQGVRAPVRKRKDSAEHKSQQKKAPVRGDGKGEGSSGQVPVAPGGVGERASGARQVRTSIATNPKTSYPTAAPYMGQSGAHRAANGVVTKTGESSGAIPAQSSGAGGADMPTNFSGMRPIVRDPKPSGVREALGGRMEVEREDTPEDDGEGVAWQLIALAIAVLVLIAGFLVWELR